MKFQAPKGTRDYFPEQMAWRRFLEDAWRRVSIRNGFDEVDGPIFEPLDLYRVKSGEGIVSELFHFEDRGGRELAIRPEFTPTLARMVAEKANSLSRPIKWFSIPNLCRAERPQRGRLREFLQWNIDMLGFAEPLSDAECILTAVDLLNELGLGPKHVKVKISHRDVVRRILARLGVSDEKMLDAFDLLDRRDKLTPEQFNESATQLGLDYNTLERFNQVALVRFQASHAWEEIAGRFAVPEQDLIDLHHLHTELKAFDIADWCEYDLGIVRGLAYYTGTVFEIHEVSGAERAMAGGGRYDQLIELMGGPSMSAVGFGMGDVVLSLVLQDKGLIPDEVMPPVGAFLIAADDNQRQRVKSLAAAFRRHGVHARFSYRSTTNVGKLLKDADSVRARFAVILDARTESEQLVAVKDLGNGEQQDVSLSQVVQHVRDQLFPSIRCGNEMRMGNSAKPWNFFGSQRGPHPGI
jgi:histidyl-tRNA synthetase